jgi:hypothetical protein
MKLGQSTPDFAPNSDASTKLDSQIPPTLIFLAKDASESLGSGGGLAVTIEQVIQIFNSYIANTNIPSLLDVDDAVDDAATGDLFVMGADGKWTYASPYSYTLAPATTLALGGVKIGSNIDVTLDGTISVTFPAAYVLPIASGSNLGGIKVGNGLSIDGGGILSTTLSSPLDYTFDWDGTKYAPYATKKLSDPSYPYFYNGLNGGYPSYQNNIITLDGGINATSFNARLSSSTYSTISYTGDYTLADAGNTVQWFTNALSSTLSAFTASSSTPITVGSIVGTGGQNNEYIKIDDNNRLFEINMTNIKLTKGTPSKWLSIDGSGFVVYNDPPAAAYTHPTQSAISLSLTGASVLASLIVNTLGHTTAYTTRTLSPSDIGLDTADLVHIAGTETVTGAKTFTQLLTTDAISAVNGTLGVCITGDSQGVGVLGIGSDSVSGYGIVGFSPNIPIQGANLTTTSSGLRTVLSLRGDSAHTVGADEYGLTTDFLMPVLGWVDPLLSEKVSGRFNCVWTDITQDNEYCRFDWWLMRGGSLTKQMTIDGDGSLTVYGNISANNFRQTVYTITLPNAGSVALRVAGATSGVDYPAGWTLNAYGLNPNDLEITHNLSRRISFVTIFELNGATEERQLFNNAAYSGIVAPTQSNMRIEALATVSKPIVIHLVFD